LLPHAAIVETTMPTNRAAAGRIILFMKLASSGATTWPGLAGMARE
jgi:hypothetical protein